MPSPRENNVIATPPCTDQAKFSKEHNESQLPSHPAKVRCTPEATRAASGHGKPAYRRSHRHYPQGSNGLPTSQQISSRHSQREASPTLNSNTNDTQPKSVSAEPLHSSLKTNACFLCFQDDFLHWTVIVDLAGTLEGRESTTPLICAEQMSLDDERLRLASYEVHAMQAIRDAAYRAHGRWKRWLPWYGIRTVEEVKFHFDDICKDGRAPIKITFLDAEAIREHAQKIMDEVEATITHGLWEPFCWGLEDHTQQCWEDQDRGKVCIFDQEPDAIRRLRGYRTRHWLKECIQSPQRAQGRTLLEHGLLQGSFIYRRQVVGLPLDAEALAFSVEMRGIYVTMGWNLGRMSRHVRTGSVYTWTGLAIVWLASVLWAGPKRDWQTAWAFGQLLAASLALILHHT